MSYRGEQSPLRPARGRRSYPSWRPRSPGTTTTEAPPARLPALVPVSPLPPGHRDRGRPQETAHTPHNPSPQRTCQPGLRGSGERAQPRTPLPSPSRSERGELLLELGLNPSTRLLAFCKNKKKRLMCHRASSPFIKEKKDEEVKRRPGAETPKEGGCGGGISSPSPPGRAPPPQTERRRGGERTGRGQSIAMVTNYCRKC